MGRKVMLWIILALVLGATSLGALTLAQRTQRSIEQYQSPYGTRSRPAPTPDRPSLSRLTGRVVLVVVDGLRNDVSHQMPFLSSLRRQGAWTELKTRVPSFSKPGYATFLTGAWAEVNGVTLNAHTGPVATDHLLRRLKEANLRSAVIGDEWWGELADGEIDYPYLYPDAQTYDPEFDRLVEADALESLRTGEASFTLIHLCGVDSAGHDRGGGGSRSYLKAARTADDRLRRIAAALDLTEDTLVVTADHGHLTRDTGGGGHGGGEPEVLTVPLVMAGRSIRPGRLTPGEIIDVVPTIAALLGVAPPLEGRGRPRWDALEVAEPVRAAFSLAQLAGTVEYAKAYLGALEGKPAGRIDRSVETAAAAAGEAETLYAAGRFGEADARSEEARRLLLQELDRRRAWAVLLERITRLPGAVIAPAVIPFLLLLLGRRRLAALGVGAAFLGLDALLYGPVLRRPWSLSALPGSGIGDFLRLFGIPEYLALALLAAPFLLMARRRRPGEALLEGLTLVSGAYLALVAVAAFGFAVNGFSAKRFLPDFEIGYVQLGALLQLGFLLPAALLLPLVALIVSARGSRSRQNQTGAAPATEAEPPRPQ